MSPNYTEYTEVGHMSRQISKEGGTGYKIFVFTAFVKSRLNEGIEENFCFSNHCPEEKHEKPGAQNL